MIPYSQFKTFEIHSKEWEDDVIGKITSSAVYLLMYKEDKPTTQYKNYIKKKAGEYITGKSVTIAKTTDDCIWGLDHEKPAIELFWSKYKRKNEGYRYQQYVTDATGRFATAPDALIINFEDKEKECYSAAVLEVKCPYTHHWFLDYMLCENVMQLKEVQPQHYWQVIDQLDVCNSATGYIMYYNPNFPDGKNYKIMKFPVHDIFKDLQELRRRKAQAIREMDEIIAKFHALEITDPLSMLPDPTPAKSDPSTQKRTRTRA